MERTPIGGVFDSHGPLKWNVCDKVSKQSLVFTTADDKLAYKSNIVAPSPRDELAGTKVFQAPSQHEANHCQPGQLTDVGAETTFKLGQKLRQYYVDEMNFLPKQYDPKEIVNQSTHIPRAQQSARYVMNGLYPSEFRDKTYVVPLFTRSSAHEILYPNWSRCARLKQLSLLLRSPESLKEQQQQFQSKLPE